jgi:secreted trypsin-like serine protease
MKTDKLYVCIGIKMKLAILLAAFSLPISCSFDTTSGLKVVGGTEDYTSHPAVVFLLIEKQDLTYGACTGTFISNTKVLTAAHCVEFKNGEKARSVAIYKHAQNIGKDPSGEFLAKTSSFSIFPGYDGNKIVENSYKDIAILNLSGDVDVPATMEIGEREPAQETRITLIGYGKTDIKSQQSNPQLKRHKASNSNFLVEGGMLYLFTDEVGMTTGGVSNGDSGGPAILNGKIVGVASYIHHDSLRKDKIVVANKELSERNPLASAYVSTSHPEVIRFIKDNL